MTLSRLSVSYLPYPVRIFDFGVRGITLVIGNLVDREKSFCWYRRNPKRSVVGIHANFDCWPFDTRAASAVSTLIWWFGTGMIILVRPNQSFFR